MMSIRGWLLFLVILSAALPVHRGDAAETDTLRLSLEDALRMAGARSYPVQIAHARLSGARAQRLESLSAFLPHLSVSEGYLRSIDPVTVFGLKLKQGVFSAADFALPALNDPDTFDNFTTTFQVRQPIVNLDAIFGNSAARLGVRAREAGLDRAGEAVALEVRRAYYGYILARESRTAIEEAVASARRHRDDARAAFDEGLVTRADLLAAEVRLADLEEQRITARNRIADAGDALRFVLGMEEPVALAPADSLPAPSSAPALDEDERIPETRADLRALELRARASRRNLLAKRSGFLPRLNAFGAVEWNAADPFREDAASWSVGAQLEWTFFDGLGHWGRSRRAEAEAHEAEIAWHQAREKAGMEIRRAERAVRAAGERVRVAERAVSQADEALRIVEERYTQGLEKTSDLLDQEVARTGAVLRRLQARHDYGVALAEWHFARGGA